MFSTYHLILPHSLNQLCIISSSRDLEDYDSFNHHTFWLKEKEQKHFRRLWEVSMTNSTSFSPCSRRDKPQQKAGINVASFHREWSELGFLILHDCPPSECGVIIGVYHNKGNLGRHWKSLCFSADSTLSHIGTCLHVGLSVSW